MYKTRKTVWNHCSVFITYKINWVRNLKHKRKHNRNRSFFFPFCFSLFFSLTYSQFNFFFFKIIFTTDFYCDPLTHKRPASVHLPLTRCSATVWVGGWCSWTAVPGRAVCRRRVYGGRRRGTTTCSSDTWVKTTRWKSGADHWREVKWTQSMFWVFWKNVMRIWTEIFSLSLDVWSNLNPTLTIDMTRSSETVLILMSAFPNCSILKKEKLWSHHYCGHYWNDGYLEQLLINSGNTAFTAQCDQQMWFYVIFLFFIFFFVILSDLY